MTTYAAAATNNFSSFYISKFIPMHKYKWRKESTFVSINQKKTQKRLKNITKSTSK